MNILKFLRLDFIPRSSDLALLVLRVWLGASLLSLHGWGKLTGFTETAKNFPDPLGVGSSEVSLALAIFGEVVCSLLLIFGLLGRLAALGSGVTMGVAFFLHHRGVLSGPQSGELAFIYLAGYVTLLIAGPGRFALDVKLGTRKPAS